MAEKIVPEDSDFLKAHIMCWEELLEELQRAGLSESDIDFDMTENKHGQFIIHLKPKIIRGIEEYYAKKSCYFPKEVSSCIIFKQADIFIEKNHATCLATLQYVVSCYISEAIEKFEEKIKAKKAVMRTGLKIAIQEAKLSSAITVKIPPIYYKIKKNEYFANLKLTIGRRLLRRVLISSKDTLDEIKTKIKGIG